MEFSHFENNSHNENSFTRHTCFSFLFVRKVHVKLHKNNFRTLHEVSFVFNREEDESERIMMRRKKEDENEEKRKLKRFKS